MPNVVLSHCSKTRTTGSASYSSTEDGEILQATEPFRPLVTPSWMAGERM